MPNQKITADLKFKTNYMIPQLIWIAIAVLGLGVHAALHGQPKEGKVNFLIALLRFAVAAVLLYYGGFFNPLLNR